MGFIGDLFSSDKGAGYQGSGTGQANAEGAVNTAAMQNRDWNSTLNAQQGIVNSAMGQSMGAMGQQQGYINTLGQQAEGKGPNPALHQLNEQTGKNVARQGALMASQRGAGANAGLMARQAGLQGADIQQQATGQAATQMANQQLAARQLQGNALQNYNANAQGYQGLAQGAQQGFMNAQSQQNASNVAMQSNINSANAGLANTNAQGQQGMFGGLLSGVGSLIGLAHGGQVPGYAEGGSIDAGPNLGVNTQLSPPAPAGASSWAGQFLSTPSQPSPTPTPNAPTNAGASPQASAQAAPAAAPSGGAQAMFQGARDLFGGKASDNAKEAMKMAPMMAMLNQGGKVKKMSPGGKVGGKAKVSGDSLKNDTVHAKLSPGEIVIPRTVVNSGDPINNSARFVAAIMGGNGRKK